MKVNCEQIRRGGSQLIAAAKVALVMLLLVTPFFVGLAVMLGGYGYVAAPLISHVTRIPQLRYVLLLVTLLVFWVLTVRFSYRCSHWLYDKIMRSSWSDFLLCHGPLGRHKNR